MGEHEEPKIIVDSDWKQQAQAEKEKLAAAEQAERTGVEEEGEGRLPKPTFTELVRLLASQALMAMGSQDPQTGQLIVALDVAQFNIELLAELEAKTKGNLEDEEAKLISQMLSELRLVYADTAKAVSQAVQEGKATSVGGRGQAGGQGGVGLQGGMGPQGPTPPTG